MRLRDRVSRRVFRRHHRQVAALEKRLKDVQREFLLYRADHEPFEVGNVKSQALHGMAYMIRKYGGSDAKRR